MLLRFKEEVKRLAENLRRTKKVHLAGLDIGPDFLKLLEINTERTPYEVTAFAIVPVPAGAIVKDEVKNPAELTKLIRNLINQVPSISKSVAIAIPRSIVLVKNTTIDSRLTPDEIEMRANIEANRHFPDLAGNTYLDFTLGDVSLQNPSQRELILVACRKDRIDPYLAIIEQCGLTVEIVDVDCYALERALPLTLEDAAGLTTIAMMNLSTQLSSFIVVHAGHLIHAHDQSYTGQRLLHQVREYLKANKLENQNHVSLEDAAYSKILKENLISHLRHTMHFFYSSRSNINIQRMELSGDCAHIPSLNLFIEQEMGIKTEIADPFKKMTLAATINQDEFKQHAPGLTLACGLALSKLDGKIR